MKKQSKDQIIKNLQEQIEILESQGADQVGDVNRYANMARRKEEELNKFRDNIIRTLFPGMVLPSKTDFEIFERISRLMSVDETSRFLREQFELSLNRENKRLWHMMRVALKDETLSHNSFNETSL